jgi:hypothetical protein
MCSAEKPGGSGMPAYVRDEKMDPLEREQQNLTSKGTSLIKVEKQLVIIERM